jgi:single-stranded DNA-binding protein
MNYEQMSNNKLYLSGEIVSDPVFSHEIYGEGFYEMSLSVPRLSDYKDVLPLTISERLITDNNIKKGSVIAVMGQFRSYNKIEDGKSRLMLTVFAREVTEAENKNPNLIALSGYICKPPVYRTTPFSREIADILLAVNRAYNKSDYIPCIAWGRNARYIRHLKVGEKIVISGRIQSRQYQKKIDEDKFEPRTAYEVSINKILSGDIQKEDEDGISLDTRQSESIYNIV